MAARDTGALHTKPMPPPSMVGPRRHAVRHIFHPFCLMRFSILISTNIAAEWAYGVLFHPSMIRPAFPWILESMFTHGGIPMGTKT